MGTADVACSVIGRSSHAAAAIDGTDRGDRQACPAHPAGGYGNELQTLGVILAWAGALPGLVLIALAIVFGAIGLNRARQVEGRGHSAALIGLIGGIGLLLAPGLLAVVGVALTLVFASL